MASLALGKNDIPILMPKLLKFKDKAEYAAGRDNSLSGREAHAIYA
tara:strand:+ start:70 stop:207 length:138 start_codon:yes stop_codon:yes gene_type:complete